MVNGYTHTTGIYFEDASAITVCQYIPSELHWSKDNSGISIRQEINHQCGSCNRVNQQNIDIMHRPLELVVDFEVSCENPIEFELKFRLPWWLKEAAKIYVNEELQDSTTAPSSFYTLKRAWRKDKVRIVLPKSLTVCPLHDRPDIVAFMEGPVVLAGLCDESRILYGDKENPESILTPDNEREWGNWIAGYRTYDQDRNIRFVPLYDIGYDKYSVYFQIKQP